MGRSDALPLPEYCGGQLEDANCSGCGEAHGPAGDLVQNKSPFEADRPAGLKVLFGWHGQTLQLLPVRLPSQ